MKNFKEVQNIRSVVEKVSSRGAQRDDWFGGRVRAGGKEEAYTGIGTVRWRRAMASEAEWEAEWTEQHT